MIRSQFNIPPDYSVSLGARKPSKIAGYDSLPVVFSHGSNETNEEFLISTDNKTLAHFDKFDLANDPVVIHRRRRPPHPRQSRRQGHGHQL